MWFINYVVVRLDDSLCKVTKAETNVQNRHILLRTNTRMKNSDKGCVGLFVVCVFVSFGVFLSVVLFPFLRDSSEERYGPVKCQIISKPTVSVYKQCSVFPQYKQQIAFLSILLVERSDHLEYRALYYHQIEQIDETLCLSSTVFLFMPDTDRFVGLVVRRPPPERQSRSRFPFPRGNF